MASGENAISPTPNSSSVWTVSYANAPSSNNSSARQPPGKDLGATFLSGTTISNSLTELYLLFKYLRPKALEKQDIRCFDAWAAIFAKKTTDFEFNVTNNIVQKGRFRYFIKVPELAAFYNIISCREVNELHPCVPAVCQYKIVFHALSVLWVICFGCGRYCVPPHL